MAGHATEQGRHLDDIAPSEFGHCHRMAPSPVPSSRPTQAGAMSPDQQSTAAPASRHDPLQAAAQRSSVTERAQAVLAAHDARHTTSLSGTFQGLSVSAGHKRDPEAAHMRGATTAPRKAKPLSETWGLHEEEVEPSPPVHMAPTLGARRASWRSVSAHARIKASSRCANGSVTRARHFALLAQLV